MQLRPPLHIERGGIIDSAAHIPSAISHIAKERVLVLTQPELEWRKGLVSFLRSTAAEGQLGAR